MRGTSWGRASGRRGTSRKPARASHRPSRWNQTSRVYDRSRCCSAPCQARRSKRQTILRILWCRPAMRSRLTSPTGSRGSFSETPTSPSSSPRWRRSTTSGRRSRRTNGPNKTRRRRQTTPICTRTARPSTSTRRTTPLPLKVSSWPACSIRSGASQSSHSRRCRRGWQPSRPRSRPKAGSRPRSLPGTSRNSQACRRATVQPLATSTPQSASSLKGSMAARPPG
mmetsp:Transcript_13688/g.35139  ORF Transcript_13688/g.35139 Transcript_13688/m.35139 type:complete len:225 (-) Transcript_13688:401-1075(-)